MAGRWAYYKQPQTMQTMGIIVVATMMPMVYEQSSKTLHLPWFITLPQMRLLPTSIKPRRTSKPNFSRLYLELPEVRAARAQDRGQEFQVRLACE